MLDSRPGNGNVVTGAASKMTTVISFRSSLWLAGSFAIGGNNSLSGQACAGGPPLRPQGVTVGIETSLTETTERWGLGTPLRPIGPWGTVSRVHSSLFGAIDPLVEDPQALRLGDYVYACAQWKDGVRPAPDYLLVDIFFHVSFGPTPYVVQLG